MSEYRRVVDLWIDVDSGLRQMTQGETFFEPRALNLWVTQQILFRTRLCVGLPSAPFVPPVGSAWYFGIDSKYGDHADVVQVGNDGFVLADWEGASLADGQICWRCDLTSEDLIEDLASAELKKYLAGLWMIPPGSKPVCLCEFDVTVRNVATYTEEPTPVEGKTFVTTDMLAGYWLQREPSASVQLGSDGLLYRYCVDDGLWRAEVVRNDSGGARLELGDGVEEVP